MSRPGTHQPGPHELGQNHLHDRTVMRDVVRLVADRDLPLVEWAAGTGALTTELALLHRPLDAVEIDPRSVARLRRAVGPHVRVVEGDILRHAPPTRPHDLVCNVPFALTSPVLRRLLSLHDWERAVLITQWEVARKRAGVGGTTLLTAQWWPWFAFALERRIPARSFRPVPAVDSGLLVVDRRPVPLAAVDRRAYQDWVRRVFTGRGSGIADILGRTGLPRRRVHAWCRAHGVRPGALPRDLTAAQWAAGAELLG